MTEMHKTLTDILESQAFERLAPFRNSASWNQLHKEERELLAKLLVMQGAHQLAQGNHQALESFDVANQVSSHAPDILYSQAVALSIHKENIRCLSLAAEALGRALEFNSQFFQASYLLAQVSTDIAHFEGDASFFFEANRRFEQAHALIDLSQESVSRGEFFWKWGLCLSALGKLSGEPLDYFQAIEKFRHAHSLGCQEVAFFNDFGLSLADLAFLLDKSEYFAEALSFFHQAVTADPLSFDGWYHQACCLQNLAEFTHDFIVLEQADHSFVQAIELNPECGHLWFKWGQLDMTIGKLRRDSLKLESSLLKFARAQQLEPVHPQILSSWAGAELLLGAQQDKLELIQSARVRIVNSLEIQPEDPDTWYLYGSCLNELGRYFHDEEYYNQAIEKFRYGLSLTRQHPLLWYGLALSYFALGELSEDQVLFEKALRYCARVIEHGGEGSPQFWNDWGVILLKLAELTDQPSHVELAIEKFERALKQPVQYIEGKDLDLEWIYNYGYAFDLLGDLKGEARYFEKAVQILSQVLQLDPYYNRARYNLALALTHLGESLSDVESYQKAVDHFQYLVDLDPEDDVIYLDFGVLLASFGLLIHDGHHPERSQSLYLQAENHFMQAALLGNVQAYYQLAGLYSITGHFKQAMDYLERAQFADMLPGIEDLLHDDWLENLRQFPPFRQFLNSLSSDKYEQE